MSTDPRWYCAVCHTHHRAGECPAEESNLRADVRRVWKEDFKLPLDTELFRDTLRFLEQGEQSRETPCVYTTPSGGRLYRITVQGGRVVHAESVPNPLAEEPTDYRVGDVSDFPPPAPQPPHASDVLKELNETLVERGRQYNRSGEERSMARVVEAFNIITGKQLTEIEGWMFMEVLKNVRYCSNPDTLHYDSALDCAAYAVLKAEAVAKARFAKEQKQ